MGKNSKQKYNTCKHAIGTGDFLVDVYPSCPHMTKVKGHLVSSKPRCQNCALWEEKSHGTLASGNK